ncbi:C-14 sterol reductase [Trichoderma cornu-damae]|uniref:Delta(14)-sterol reductase n=1 Tax=Trichoderma cornu-damae TaxID=654480 RepID=A0A9P8QR15_9HYPO|nr:C-14 sterol reductase [Trichoderma cornu-damae]
MLHSWPRLTHRAGSELLPSSELRGQIAWPEDGIWGFASWEASGWTAAYYLLSPVLYRVLPGQELYGTKLRESDRPLKYKLNAFSSTPSPAGCMRRGNAVMRPPIFVEPGNGELGELARGGHTGNIIDVKVWLEVRPGLTGLDADGSGICCEAPSDLRDSCSLTFGDIVWVPFLYSTQTRYLSIYPLRLGWVGVSARVARFSPVGLYVFRASNTQKRVFGTAAGPPQRQGHASPFIGLPTGAAVATMLEGREVIQGAARGWGMMIEVWAGLGGKYRKAVKWRILPGVY